MDTTALHRFVSCFLDLCTLEVKQLVRTIEKTIYKLG